MMAADQPEKIVIIGAGPAGVSCAAELAKYGLKSTLIDEASKIGGVIYRGPLRQTTKLPHLDENLKRSMAALKVRYSQYEQDITLQLQTKVLGPEGKNCLLLQAQEKITQIEYNKLVLATGCHERSVPFDGWQLPGVMLMGGMQLQLKSGLVRPGRKVALVGTGPLLPLVACQLHKAGAQVVGVFEASRFSDLAKETVSLLQRPTLTLSGLSMLAYLKKHQIPFKYGYGIVKAEGQSQLSGITVAPFDENWHANVSKAQHLEVDSLGVGYGFVARTQLAMLLGLSHQYTGTNGYIPMLDDNLRSSLDDVYVCGDGNGLLGAEAAIIEGKIAATALAYEQHCFNEAQYHRRMRKLKRQRKQVQKFRAGFDRFSARREGLLALTKPDTVICRCEQVKRQQLDVALAQGAKDLSSIKMRTRIGMGDCQGKMCSSYALDRLHAEGHIETLGVIRPRFPLDPIPFTLLENNNEAV
ncbi:FAD/NAD(P)-dependent oxidoreductase [Pseudoalteromonas peptidolytica]|uniref:FAD/NAD(P)-dependent oxidoreductase n=1 Tax=Pseudoalteromonas peptidolytica TaxID=61150 RepID=UPI00298E4CC1|nr:NAD(P)/FAD-dependent oxidoreductase [Pseudoalteromonas peptidolytica]MDW7547649.1 NAD(P)/FAD-dependent oxidoreductase [Pseudoalteromonas peptidolytica]